MAVSVVQQQNFSGDKVAAASKTMTGSLTTFATSDEIQIISFGWLGSVTGQTMTAALSGALAGRFTLTKLGGAESTGKNGLAVFMLALAPGANPTIPALGVDLTITFTVNTGTINAYGVIYHRISGAAPDAVAVTFTDSGTTTSAAPTATSASAAIGDLVIGVIANNGPTGDAVTGDTDTVGGSWVTLSGTAGTSGGSATTNERVLSQYKIPTAAGTQTYNPTFGTARTYIEGIFIIKPKVVTTTAEVNGGTSEIPILLASILPKKDGKESGFVSQGSDNFDVGPLDANFWAAQWRYSFQPVVSGGVISGTPSGLSDALYGYVGMSANSGKWRISALASAMGSSFTPNIGFLCSNSHRYYLFTGTTVAGGNEIDVYDYSTGTDVFVDSATPGNAVFAPGDIVILELDFITGTLTVIRSRAGVETVAGGPYSSVGAVNVSADLKNGFAWFPYFLFQANNTDSFDNFDVSLQVITSMADESGSVVQGGGSTPISGSDTNGSMTEATTTKTSLTQTDVNGATAETGIPVGVHATSDVNSATTEASAEVGQYAQGDSNGPTTEFSAYTSPVLAADANGATTEMPTLATASIAADQNGATSETSGEITAAIGSDANGATTEASKMAFIVSDVDTSAGEALNEIVVGTVSDTNGSDVETVNERTSFAGTDFNGATAEASAEAVKLTQVDVSAVTETQTFAASTSVTDQNSGEIESGGFVNPVVAGDVSATSEASVLAAVLAATDVDASSGEDATPSASLSAADNGSDNEVSTLSVTISIIDFNGSGENAILGAVLPVSDANVSTGDQGTLALNYILTDDGSNVEAFTMTANFSAAEINGETETGAASSTGATLIGVTDTGSGAASMTLAVKSNASESGSSTAAAVLTARYRFGGTTDTAGGSESVVQGRGSADTGLGAESGSPAVLWLSSDTGTDAETAENVARAIADELGGGNEDLQISVNVVGDDQSAVDFEDFFRPILPISDVVFDDEIASLLKIVVKDDFGVGADASLITKWPYFPDEPPEVLTASKLEQAVLVGAGQGTAELTASNEIPPVVETAVPQKPSITRVGSDKPNIERTR